MITSGFGDCCDAATIAVTMLANVGCGRLDQPIIRPRRDTEQVGWTRHPARPGAADHAAAATSRRSRAAPRRGSGSTPSTVPNGLTAPA